MHEYNYIEMYKMSEYDIVNEFSYAFFDMNYTVAMQIVGIMKAKGLEDARRLESMLLFEQKKYLKIRTIFSNVFVFATEEKEFYFASLLELGLVDEFKRRYKEIQEYERNKFFPDRNKITIDCYYYLIWLSNNKELDDSFLQEIRYDSNKHGYFYRKYYERIVEELVYIYCLNEEKLELEKADIPVSDIEFVIKKIQKRFNNLKKIYYVNNVEQFEKYFKENKSIPVDMITWVAKGNINSFGPRGYGIYDIVHYAEYLRRLGSKEVLKVTQEYKKQFKSAVASNNQYTIDYLKNLYLSIINDSEEDRKLAKDIEDIFENTNFLQEEIELHGDEPIIINLLSKKGKIAYKAAINQFRYFFEHELGASDAGMLCLAYIRILELEVNQRIIYPLLNHAEDLEELYYKNLYLCSIDKKQGYEDTWSYVISQIGEVATGNKDGFEMGAICKLFDSMSVKRYRYENTENIRELLFEFFSKILTEKGLQSFSDMKNIFSKGNREKYRNPPAHTRYVALNTAIECRSFVEKSLYYINECIK